MISERILLVGKEEWRASPKQASRQYANHKLLRFLPQSLEGVPCSRRAHAALKLSFSPHKCAIWLLIYQAFSGQWWAFRVKANEHLCRLWKSTLETRPLAPTHPPVQSSHQTAPAPAEVPLTVVFAISPAQPRHGPRWRAANPMAGRPSQGAGRSQRVEGGADPCPGTRNRRARSSPLGGARLGGGVRGQQPEGFPKGNSCFLGSRHPRRDSSGSDSPKQELPARGEDFDWEMQGALMVAVVITEAQTSLLVAVITTT